MQRYLHMKIFGAVLLIINCNAVQAQDTQGFFLNGLQPAKTVVPPAQKAKAETGAATVTVEVNTDSVIATVSKYLFGNNTNPYMTQIVTQPVLLNQIEQLSPNVLRFPGGNISNLYFWDKAPGQKPADVPDTILYGDSKPKRERFWVGNNNSPNSLSLANYYQLLQQTGSAGSICVNVGYARYGTGSTPITTAAHYAADWVRFDKGRTRFWEVGNEDYGTWEAGYKIDTTLNKDGQPAITNGTLYGKIFKAYSDSMHAAARETGATIYVGATIIEAKKNKPWDKPVDKNWNRLFFASAKNTADFFIVHSYYTPYNKNSRPLEILRTGTTVTRDMMQYLHQMANDNSILLKPVALTEWNIFAQGSKQATSYVNGMHAAIVLGELAKNKFGMACRWNLANAYANGNDHGMFSQGDEPGMPRWSARPPFYYMYYFRRFFGGTVVAANCGDSNVVVYASVFADGKKGLVLINKDTVAKTIAIHFNKAPKRGRAYSYTLTGGTDNALFSQQVFINGAGPALPAGGPGNFETIKAFEYSFNKHVLIQTIPAMGVKYLLAE